MNNKHNNIIEQISALLKENGDMNFRNHNPSYNYVHDSTLDSFSLLNFTLNIEATFSVSLSSDELSLSDSHTINGLTLLILKKLDNLKS